MTFYTILALTAFILSLIGTRLTILAFRQRTLPASPASVRGQLPMPVPHTGGVVVVFCLIICLLVADIHYVLVLSLLLLAAVSLLDELLPVHRFISLLVQLIAVLVALASFHTPIFSASLPHWLDHFLAIVLWIGFTNIFTQFDDMDGLSASGMVALGIGVCFPSVLIGAFPTPLSVYGLIVASAGCGFLWWSWFPAKIRLGRVGTVPIGFLLGYLLLLAIAHGYWAVAAILPAYYLADVLITQLKRFYQRQNGTPLSDYYCKHAVDGRTSESVVRYILGIHILLVFLAARAVLDEDIAIFNVAMAYMAVFMLLGFLTHPHQHLSKKS